VEVLEEDEEGNSRVRTDKGIEGWLLTRYLSAERSARDRLADLQEENRVLQGESQRLTEAIAAARGDAEEARTQAGRLQQESNGLRADLDQLRRAAARPLELAEENRRLQADLQKAREGYETARAEAELLRDTGYRRWFVTGAAVAGGGLLLGLILPRILSRPRRARWDRL
jgi:SH3 domain protein